MRYLLNAKKRVSAAHYWDGSNTLCKMYATGGMRPERQQVFDSSMGKKICLMCINNYRSRQATNVGDTNR